MVGSEKGWTCEICTFVNKPLHLCCDACSFIRPNSPEPARRRKNSDPSIAAAQLVVTKKKMKRDTHTTGKRERKHNSERLLASVETLLASSSSSSSSSSSAAVSTSSFAPPLLSASAKSKLPGSSSSSSNDISKVVVNIDKRTPYFGLGGPAGFVTAEVECIVIDDDPDILDVSADMRSTPRRSPRLMSASSKRSKRERREVVYRQPSTSSSNSNNNNNRQQQQQQKQQHRQHHPTAVAAQAKRKKKKKRKRKKSYDDDEDAHVNVRKIADVATGIVKLRTRAREKKTGSSGNPHINVKVWNHLIYLDIDNWGNFFQKLPGNLPSGTLVQGFLGGKTAFREPNRNSIFKALRKQGGWKLHKRCGTTKNAADFAIAVQLGKDDERFPESVPFTIVSGDRGFGELLTRTNPKRKVNLLDPHRKDFELTFALLVSMSDC